MNNSLFTIADKLIKNHSLTPDEYEQLVSGYSKGLANYLSANAVKVRKNIYSNQVFIRGLIEISNICKNNCFYCGIRGGNHYCQRYRLTPKEIMQCCVEGYELGFRTFVLQGGEDGFYTDEMLCHLISNIKKVFPDCAVTLSLGERSKESYRKLFDAGADRYLLRHEAADKELYEKLHPTGMSFENRMNCLKNLKDIGFQTGCGFMVGAPYQTARHIAKDLKFIEEFKPDMCGIGPFIPHRDTIYAKENAGSADLTCYLLSIIRLIHPNILLPATTALGTVSDDGRERGILSGANVVMPNLSPESARKKYELYNNKLNTGVENAFHIAELKKRMENIGYEVVVARGDVARMRNAECGMKG
ncbi:MAG: [FeFe] hydrogenase H-cluster radical SAM maturase HydE [Ruminococcaceae bacterium]|nr:[FeFe] hydrogenase H-cluster radical SAM maturase HydE [Oscillospiraceae bacterium]